MSGQRVNRACSAAVSDTTRGMVHVVATSAYPCGVCTKRRCPFLPCKPRPNQRLALCATIQFAGALHAARGELASYFSEVVVPQCKPLSSGETLGCTAPLIEGSDVCIFLADGR